MDINKLQQWCYELEKFTGERSSMNLLGEASQEFGEAVRSVLMHEGVNVRRQEDNVAKELFDLFYNFAVIAAQHKIDLESVFEKAIEKYEKRFKANIWRQLNEKQPLNKET